MDENVYAATLVLASTDRSLEEADHPQVLLIVCSVLNLIQHGHSFSFVDPFAHLNLCHETHLTGTRDQGLLQQGLQLLRVLGYAGRDQVVTEVWRRGSLVAIF